MAYDAARLTKLSALQELAQKVKSSDASLQTQIDSVSSDLSDVQTKVSDIVSTGGEPNTIESISVNGAEVSTDESKNANITVPTKTSELDNDSDYQSASDVSTAIAEAIAAAGHASFEIADAVPTVETAVENVMYLVLNTETSHYDIYALVSNEVVLLDDTTVDLSAYFTSDEVNAAISNAVVVATDEEVSEMLTEVFGE
ncbi:MAG: hypothetical protein LIO59_00285 [Oscillospiraceae bacterium]|nr:hypothetical protein [Oscillospiraceae bacterium]